MTNNICPKCGKEFIDKGYFGEADESGIIAVVWHGTKETKDLFGKSHLVHTDSCYLTREEYDEVSMDEYLDFGDISRGKLGLQCQYGSNYINGNCGSPNLGKGLRFIGNDRNYHSYKIHKDDVEEFVRRYNQYKME